MLCIIPVIEYFELAIVLNYLCICADKYHTRYMLDLYMNDAGSVLLQHAFYLMRIQVDYCHLPRHVTHKGKHSSV